MTTTRAHRLATMSTVASAFTAAVCSIFGDVLDAAPRARASARRQSRKRRSSDTGSDTPAVFSAPASRALARAAPCLAVIVLAALFTTARADGGRYLLQGGPVAAGRNTPVAQARGDAKPRGSPRSAGHNAATSSSRTTTTSPRTITGDDDEDALGRTGGNSCPLPPCVTECQTKLKKCLLPWKGNEGDDRCGATSAEECLAIFACCINDECKDCPPCVNPDSCIDDCLPGDPGCCCDGFQCEGGTCVPPCVNPDSCTDGCEPGEPGCCCDGSYCSSNDLTCKPGSCETAMAKGASACFPEKSWGWAVELSDTQIGPVEVPIIAAAGGNCESPDQEEVGTASISADGLSVKLTPGPAFSFTEVHIDVQCTQPTTRDAPGQYNWNDLAADLDPCPASDTCTYLSVGSVSGTCLETCGSGPCWFRIHVKACDAT